MSLTKVTYSMIKGSPANVLDFGAVGDGVADDTAAFNAAMAASTDVYIPSGIYKITSTLTIPANTALQGANRESTKILHAFNGDLINFGANAVLSDLWLAGQGSTYTGQGVVYVGTDGNQTIQNCKIVDFAAACLYFNENAGSRSSTINLITFQTNGGTGTGNYAIVIEDTGSVVVGATPRKFVNIETAGFCSFFFGSSNSTYVTTSFLGDLFYSLSSRATFITGCRIANQLALTIQGNNHTLIGCGITPQITIQSGSDNIAIQGNSYNSLPIIDNSGNARNLIDVFAQAYTPTLTSGGTAPSLGNGTITGGFTRQGATTFIVGELTLGSTTSLGTGGLSISLPQRRWSGDTFCGGTVVMNRGGTLYTGTLQITGSVTTATLIRDTSGSITFNSPAVFATGDTIRWSAIYSN
jgi:hypothetical protein